MPISRETTSNAALSGGNNLATALSLNACPYRATEILHRRPLIVEFYRHDNYSDAAGYMAECLGRSIDSLHSCRTANNVEGEHCPSLLCSLNCCFHACVA